MVQEYMLKQQDMINKDKPMTQDKPGELMYIISPQMFLLKISSRMFRIIYIGPLLEYSVIDKFQYILMDNEAKILNDIFNFNRFKQAFLRTTKGPVSTLVYLKQVINLGIRISEQT